MFSDHAGLGWPSGRESGGLRTDGTGLIGGQASNMACLRDDVNSCELQGVAGIQKMMKWKIFFFVGLAFESPAENP